MSEHETQTKIAVMPKKTDFSKYSFFPILYESLLKFYRDQFDVLWTVGEIDMSADRADWETLDESLQNVVRFVLCFFAQIDGLVIENITQNFQAETGDRFKEAGHFYAVQNLIETVHNEMYSTAIEVLITDPVEYAKTLNAIDNYPSIKKIAVWMKTWMESDKPLYQRIVAFACIEGILFVALFVIIYHVKRQNKLTGLCKANEFIARDEALHALFAIELYKILRQEDTKLGVWPSREVEQKVVTDIVADAVRIAEELVRNSMEDDLVGLAVSDLVQYIKVTADALIVQLGFEPIYKSVNPFDWMVTIGIVNRTNFFEGRVSEYSKLNSKSLKFSIDADF